MSTRVSLAIPFIFSASLLPLSLIYLRFFQSATYTAFTLDKVYELPIEEIVGLFLLGELIYGFDLRTIFLVVIGSIVALLCMIYLLYKSKKKHDETYQMKVLFLFLAFLMILVDYRILKLFMEGLPLNEERLWVFRDFIAAPFVALAMHTVVSTLKTYLQATSPSNLSIISLKALSKGNIIRISTSLFALNILIPVILGGWITFSLSAAYPRIAPLQTTWYELDAVKHIEENTTEKYVVIGDIWTIYAGGMIAGTQNPRAYYFAENDPRGYDLFSKMKKDSSPQIMLEAMNQTGTDTTIAYFIVTEPRLGTDEFNNVVSKALQNGLQVYATFGNEKLYIFRLTKT